jgi:hypothetical protein
MKNMYAPALLAQLQKRAAEGPLPVGHAFPKGWGFAKKMRPLAKGGYSQRILYRAPTEYRPTRKDNKKRLMSWLFAWTWAGYIEALDHKIGIESTLKTAKAAADKRGSKLYMPTVCECVDDCLADPDVKAMRSLSDLKRHLAVLTKHCGCMLVNTVTHRELRQVIKAEYDRELSYESLRRLLAAISKLFKWALGTTVSTASHSSLGSKSRRARRATGGTGRCSKTVSSGSLSSAPTSPFAIAPSTSRRGS